MRLLLAAPGIDGSLNVADDDGETPLYVACSNNHMEIVQLLLAAPGIDITAANIDGETPMYVACRRNHPEIVRQLLTTDSGLNAATVDGRTHLHVVSG